MDCFTLDKSNNIQVAWNANHSELFVCVPFKDATSIYKLPEDTPNKETFVSLVLHQSDFKIAYGYLCLISNGQDISINEALFVAALNSCIKCFKGCKSRQKLFKKNVFQDEQLLSCFSRFECIRDKHYAHDENGMLRPIATMLVSKKISSNSVVFRPWVIWNRERLDFIQESIQLKELVEYISNYIQEQLDSLAKGMVSFFVEKYKFGDNLELVDSVAMASYNVARNSRDAQINKIPIRILYTNTDTHKNGLKCD